MIARAETDDALMRCVEIRNAVDPQNPLTLADVRDDAGAVLLLHDGGGYALVKRSSMADTAFTMVRVMPESRRNGVGSALLDAATEAARELGVEAMWGRVRAGDDESLRFLLGRGFAEVGRDVSLVRELAADEGPLPPAIVELAADERPQAYAVYVEGVEDMPLWRPTTAMTFDEWTAEECVVTLVAHVGDAVVGYAELRPLHAQPHRLEHGMTAVLRSHRRCGIASALKRATIAWAAQHGYSELVTYTQERNDGMRAVNLAHGYVEVPCSVELSRALG